VRKVDVRTSGRVESKIEKLAPVAFLVRVHHLRPRSGLVRPMSVKSDWVGYHVYLRHGTSVCWHNKSRLESGSVTADLTDTVVHSYKSLIKDVKPVYSLTCFFKLHLHYHTYILAL